jgi:glutamate racemase
MWVPLVENNEFNNEGADYFIKKHLKNILDKGENIDTLLLACTHYPILKEEIEKYLPEGITLISQGEIVANSLADYLNRHPEIESKCSKSGINTFFTTDSTQDFDSHASIFFGESVYSKHIDLTA